MPVDPATHDYRASRAVRQGAFRLVVAGYARGTCPSLRGRITPVGHVEEFAVAEGGLVGGGAGGHVADSFPGKPLGRVREGHGASGRAAHAHVGRGDYGERVPELATVSLHNASDEPRL